MIRSVRILTGSLKSYITSDGRTEAVLHDQGGCTMKLVPLDDKVVLKKAQAEETTKSGIVLTGQDKEKPAQGEVIAVGPGGVIDGKEIKMQVKPGDKVVYSKYAGTEVEIEDKKYLMVKQGDILAIIK